MGRSAETTTTKYIMKSLTTHTSRSHTSLNTLGRNLISLNHLSMVARTAQGPQKGTILTLEDLISHIFLFQSADILLLHLLTTENHPTMESPQENLRDIPRDILQDTLRDRCQNGHKNPTFTLSPIWMVLPIHLIPQTICLLHLLGSMDLIAEKGMNFLPTLTGHLIMARDTMGAQVLNLSKSASASLEMSNLDPAIEAHLTSTDAFLTGQDHEVWAKPSTSSSL
jgi:hypothetical protein